MDFFKKSKSIFLTLILLSIFIFHSCAGNRVIVEKSKNILSLEIHGTMNNAIPMKVDEKIFMLDYTIRNTSKQNIYSIEAIIFFLEDGEPVQEYGPVVLYNSQAPLKPNYFIDDEILIKTKPFNWHGKKFKVKIIKTATEPVKKKKSK